MLLVSDADNLAQMSLGVQPAQGMLEDVELARFVGDNHRVAQQAARDDAPIMAASVANRR